MRFLIVVMTCLALAGCSSVGNMMKPKDKSIVVNQPKFIGTSDGRAQYGMTCEAGLATACEMAVATVCRRGAELTGETMSEAIVNRVSAPVREITFTCV